MGGRRRRDDDPGQVRLPDPGHLRPNGGLDHSAWRQACGRRRGGGAELLLARRLREAVRQVLRGDGGEAGGDLHALALGAVRREEHLGERLQPRVGRRAPARRRRVARRRRRAGWCVGGGPFGDDATEPAGVAAPTPSASCASRASPRRDGARDFSTIASAHSHALCTRNASRAQSPNRTCDGYAPHSTTPPRRRPRAPAGGAAAAAAVFRTSTDGFESKLTGSARRARRRDGDPPAAFPDASASTNAAAASVSARHSAASAGRWSAA